MKKLAAIKPLFYSVCLILGFGIFGTSCKKDKTDPVQTPTVRVKEYKNGDEYMKFAYNPDGSIKSMMLKNELNTEGDEVVFNVVYKADKKIDYISSSAGEKVVATYQNNQIVKADYFMEATQTGTTEFHYNNGNLDRATIYTAGEAGFEAILEFDLTYNAAGNCTQSVAKVDLGNGQLEAASTSTFQHDQKTNPLYQYKEILWLLWQPVSKNNVIEEKQFDEEQQLTDQYLYTYTYNGNGLPTLATVKEGLPGETPVNSEVAFIYE